MDDEKKFDWLKKKLYTGGEITVGEAFYQIMLFFLRNAITKKALDNLITLLFILLPKPNYFPRSKYLFLKLLFSLIPNHRGTIVKHQSCEECCHYLGIYSKQSRKKICDQCNSNDVNGEFLQYNLKQVFIDAFENRHLANLIDKHQDCEENEDYICDVNSATQYRKLEQERLQGKYDLCLLWNTDGVSVSKSSKGEIWPIQVQILNTPPQNRRNFQFLAGLYYSNVKKPNMDTFLKPFTVALKDLYENGFDWLNKSTNLIEHSIVIAPVATLDCPARAAVQNLMQFNGAYGCSFCEHPGTTCATGLGHTRIYSKLNIEPRLRTEERMIKQARKAINNNLEHVKGVKAVSVTAMIPLFDVATSFVPDYMNAVLSGVVTMLMDLWFHPKNRNQEFYIKKAAREAMDIKIKKIAPPDFIARIPRRLKYRKYYKASEIRDMLLLYFPVLLKGVLPDIYYEYFLLLFYGIRILLKSKIHNNEINFANYLLKLFSKNIEKLYGREKCSFNVHQLNHMSEAVRRWGPLWCWSTFPFEDANGYYARVNHGPNKVDIEIMNTIKMVNAFYSLREKLFMVCNEIVYEEQVLGVSRKININSNEKDALQDLIDSNQIIVQDNSIFVYIRAKINNQVFTSKIYERQKKEVIFL